MRFTRDLSIRSKLTMISMIVSTAALLIASAVFMAKDVMIVRRELLEGASTSAQMVGNNCTAALSFHSAQDAAEVLSAMRADPKIDAAWIFTPDGKVFATYFRNRKLPAPAVQQVRPGQHVFTDEYLEVYRSIDLNGQTLGTVVVRANLNELTRRFYEYVGGIAAIVCAASIVSFILATQLQRFISRPIFELTETAKAVSSGKNYALRAAPHGNDELGALVCCFNEMLGEIQRRDQQLQSHRDHLEEVVAVRTVELTHVNEQLMVAKDRAEQSNRAKSAFLANMSHEIRTPMTAIIGYADMMLDPDQTRSDRQDCLQIIRRNAAHLLDLLNDILDISKIEADKMTIERIKVDLPRLLGEVVSLMRPRAADKGLGFEMSFADPTPRHIRTDALRLKQVLVNLLGNAVKFTTTGQVGLHVSCTSDGPLSRVRFDVWDTGVGIAPDQLHKLFLTFSQADESTTRRHGGSGLGLAISKRLALLLGGDITVESTPEQGSHFILEIDAGSLEGVEMLHNAKEAMLEPKTAPANQSSVRLSGRILFAEDGLDNQRLISMHLRKAGADVVIAPNGKVAMNLLASEPFDLVLLDMQMPVLDGYATASKLRSGGFTKPIIALTAHALAEDRGKCIQAGCTDYLTKPIDRQKLLSTVAGYLSGANSTATESVAQAAAPADAEPAHAVRSQFAGDPDMRELVEEYVQRLPVEVAKLKSLLEAGEVESLRRVAHQLKGSGGGYGFGRITELAAVVDRSIKENASLESVRNQIDALVSYIRRIHGYDRSLETLNAAKGANN